LLDTVPRTQAREQPLRRPDRIDLEAYLAHIGYRGERSRSVATLNALAAAHTQAVPFSNVDILLGRPVLLEAGAVQRKLVEEGRGGYCFEHNGLMQRVLATLGFAVTPLAARVRLEAPRRLVPPRTHMLLKVEADGESWLIDVGFGRLSIACALRLGTEAAQPTPHETRRLVAKGGRLFHQMLVGREWRDIYEFTFDEMHPSDQELANWWTSTSPSSKFRTSLTAARSLPGGGRVTIHNRQLSLHGGDGSCERHEILSPEHLLSLLQQHLGLRYPQGTRIDIPAAPWPGA
jgi:N-hydroxyarylamine O-acetyltransferase